MVVNLAGGGWVVLLALQAGLLPSSVPGAGRPSEPRLPSPGVNGAEVEKHRSRMVFSKAGARLQATSACTLANAHIPEP